MMSGVQMEKTYNESFVEEGLQSKFSGLDKMNKQEKIDQVKFIAPKRSQKRPNVPSRAILSKLLFSIFNIYVIK